MTEMRSGSRLAALAALMGALLAAQPASAQHGPAHGGWHDGAMASSDGFAADMQVVHELLAAHEAIRRTVTHLPDGVRTVTESDDPRIAEYLRTHVASMDRRMADGDVFNMTSTTIPVIFQNADRIRTEIEETATGVVFTQTTDDPELVAVLQAHAEEVSELAREGMAAMMRGMMNQGGSATGPGGTMPHATPGPGPRRHHRR